LKPAKKIDSGYLPRIFGTNSQERICTTIKNLVIEQQSGNENFDEEVSDVQSVSDDEESKTPTKSSNNIYKIPFEHKDSQISSDEKEKISLFYVYLMSVDRDIVDLTNSLHREWISCTNDYDKVDAKIQRENITRRIPEHLDEEDKIKFELIRQGSSFKNEEFYKQYIEPEALEIMRRESSEREHEEFK
jgi:hypothetical protein